LLVKGKPASTYIKRLSNLAALFDLRLSGIFYFLLNNTLSWDFHCIYRIEKLVNDIKAEMPIWLNAAGRVEALCSFANLYFNHPGWALPGFVEEGFKLEAEKIGHPLIPANERVNNDIKLSGSGRIMIVTGSNMAGKSTFLRMIGVNLVLAYAGAPVCARRFVVSPLKLYSSMKVSDSLDKKLSLFYTELQHLKKILDGVERGEPVFFIIDEMLKGTNTKDRRQGAVALIKQLLRHNVPGLIATHDLELSRLEEEYPRDIINFHFDGYVKDDRLEFDYKLKKGVCSSFNALTLMRKIGIQV
jgi:DNA mismatch repair ATPase MutS